MDGTTQVAWLELLEWGLALALLIGLLVMFGLLVARHYRRARSPATTRHRTMMGRTEG